MWKRRLRADIFLVQIAYDVIKEKEDYMRDFSTPKHYVTNILKDAMYINNTSKVILCSLYQNYSILQYAAETITKIARMQKA